MTEILQTAFSIFCECLNMTLISPAEASYLLSEALITNAQLIISLKSIQLCSIRKLDVSQVGDKGYGRGTLGGIFC